MVHKQSADIVQDILSPAYVDSLHSLNRWRNSISAWVIRSPRSLLHYTLPYCPIYHQRNTQPCGMNHVNNDIILRRFGCCKNGLPHALFCECYVVDCANMIWEEVLEHELRVFRLVVFQAPKYFTETFTLN